MQKVSAGAEAVHAWSSRHSSAATPISAAAAGWCGEPATAGQGLARNIICLAVACTHN